MSRRKGYLVTTINDAKAAARRLRTALSTELPGVSHSKALELTAAALGYKNWNTFVASEDSGPLVVPVLRTFPGPQASRFYLDFLGFSVDWEHRFEPSLPLYRQVSRDGIVLHLSEHHGDATPGSAVRLRVADVIGLQQHLLNSEIYPLRIGVETQEWGVELSIPDPFGNTLTFHTPTV